VAQSGMMKGIFWTQPPRSVRIFSWNIQRTSGRNLWCYGVSGRCNKIALHFAGVPASDGMFCAARWVVRTLCGCVTKVKTIFLHVVLKRTSLSTESRNIQTNRIVCGYSFCKAHSASYAVESYQSLYLKCITPSLWWQLSTTKADFIEQKSMRPKCPVVLSTPLCQQKWMWNYCIWSWRLPRFYATRRARF
jgi:hypothetical protein